MPSGHKRVVCLMTGLLLALVARPVCADPSGGPLFYDQRRLPDMEVERRNQDVLEEQRRAEEEKRRDAEATARKQAEDLKQADEERRLAAAAEAKRRADDEKRLAVEAEAKRKTDEETRLAAEAEAKRKADDEKRLAAEAEAKRKADDEKRLAAEAEAKRKADDEKRLAAEAEAKRKADDEKRLAAEAETKRNTTETSALQQPSALPRVAANIPQMTAPQPGQQCEAARIEAKPLSGGLVQVTIDSACRRGQILVAHYGAYDLTRKLGPNGQLVFTVDMFLGSAADFSIGFADGSAQTATLPAADLSGLSKVALIWQAPVDLNLHAVEGGGTFGKDGHRWSGAASSLDAAKASSAESGHGAGYLSTAETASREGTKIEVYTFVHNPDQENGAVSMLVDYASRGAVPSGDKCGTGALAEIPFDVVILDHKGRVSTESGVLPSAPCGTPLTFNARYLKGVISDLRFRN